MTSYQVQGLLYVDDDMTDGYVRVEGELRTTFTMTTPTYRALSRCEGALDRMIDGLWDSRGEFLLPRSAIETEAAADLRQSLSITDPEPSAVCIYMPCMQDAAVEVDGFHLCAEHAALMRSWDDLVA